MRRRSLFASITFGAVLVAGASVPAAIAAPAKKPAYKVTTAVSATTVKTSHTVRISGKVSPASRAVVKLQRFYAKKWHNVASQKLNKSSRYSFTTNVGKAATTLSYRVVKPRTKTVNAGNSKTLKVKVVTWGTVKSWGANSNGEAGIGTVSPTDLLTPKVVKGLTEVVAVDANDTGQSAYALRYDGTVWAWGANYSAQLGRAAGPASGTPTKVGGLTGVKAIAALSTGALALKSDGTVWVWGANDDGQFGTGATSAFSGTPRKIAALSKVKAIAAGDASGYALKTDGTLWTWGRNNYGDLARGTTGNSVVPVGKAIGLPKLSKIAASGDNGYAIGPYGTVYAWGYNNDGNLGNGTVGAAIGTPVLVPGLAGITALGTAYDTAYAVGSGGTVWSWGEGQDGATGTGLGSDDQHTPARVAGLAGVRSVGGADVTGYALMGNGTVRAWGAGYDGELGNGGTGIAQTPVTVTGVAHAVAVSGASATGYALLG